MINVFEEHDLDYFVTSMIKVPTTIAGRTNYNKNQAKTKMIIYESVKEKLMSLITPLKKTKECFDTLTNIYEKKAPSQKRALKNKLHNMKMERDETIASFFTKISQVKDQLANIGVETDEDNLLQTVIDGLPTSWETFFATVNGREE